MALVITIISAVSVTNITTFLNPQIFIRFIPWAEHTDIGQSILELHPNI